MRIIDKESHSGKIIRALGMGVGIMAALSNERASYDLSKKLIRSIFGFNKTRSQVSQYFSRLRKQKLIDIKKDGNCHKLTLTEDGRRVFFRFNYEDIEIKTPAIWDRNFRMVLFDIPEKLKPARDSLRLKMQDIGFVRFNDSVWVYPYPCQKEIDFIANYWEIGKYVHFALVKDITNREGLEKYFDL